MLFFKLNLFKKTIDIKLNPAIIISNKKKYFSFDKESNIK